MEFKAGDMIRFGWETFKKRPWIFIGTFLATIIINWLIGAVTAPFWKEGVMSVIGFAVSFSAQTLFSMGMIALFLKAHESVESVSLKELWHPNQFWFYLGTTILVSIAILVGLILLIIPGFIAMLGLQFSSYIVVDKNLSPVKALKESMRITKGHLWELLILLAFIIVLNIFGVLALLVGLFVTVPVSMLAMVHAYRVLEHKASEVTPLNTS